MRFIFLFLLFSMPALAQTTDVGRMGLTHPDKGFSGSGTTLHTAVRDAWTELSDHVSSRYFETTGVADSATTSFTHSFGLGVSDFSVALYTGTGSSKVRVDDPAAAGWVIADNGGSPKLILDVTAPGSGGPHDFTVEFISGIGPTASTNTEVDQALIFTDSTLVPVGTITLDVTNQTRFHMGNQTTTINNFSGGVNGQVVYIVMTSSASNLTLVSGNSTGGDQMLIDGSTRSYAGYRTIKLTYYSGSLVWFLDDDLGDLSIKADKMGAASVVGGSGGTISDGTVTIDDMAATTLTTDFAANTNNNLETCGANCDSCSADSRLLTRTDNVVSVDFEFDLNPTAASGVTNCYLGGDLIIGSPDWTNSYDVVGHCTCRSCQGNSVISQLVVSANTSTDLLAFTLENTDHTNLENYRCSVRYVIP